MNLWAIVWAYVIKYLKRFYLQYYDFWIYILLFRLTTFSIYYCFFGFRNRYSFYTGAGVYGSNLLLHQRYSRVTLNNLSINNKIKTYKNPISCLYLSKRVWNKVSTQNLPIFLNLVTGQKHYSSYRPTNYLGFLNVDTDIL